MNYWRTSDYGAASLTTGHFSHANIIKYCGRPFETVEEMNETIIHKYNERVKPEDTAFFLGDFICKGGKEGGEEKYRYFEKRLNGKFIFIKGNHDRHNSLNMIISKVYIHYGSKDICMTHIVNHRTKIWRPWHRCSPRGFGISNTTINLLPLMLSISRPGISLKSLEKIFTCWKS